jgi:hypothetical protein
MKNFRYYFKLMSYPLGFFAVLGGVELLILREAYQQQADRQVQPYVDGSPIPEVQVEIDRRPQSINIPSIDTGPKLGPVVKTDRLATPSP